MDNIIIVLATNCPVIGVLIWFLVMNTKANHKRDEWMMNEFSRREERLADQFHAALDKVVTKIGERLDRIEGDLKTHIIKKNHDTTQAN